MNSWPNGYASMSGTNDLIEVGEPLPTIASVKKGDGPFDLRVQWASGPRKGQIEVIDVAPQIMTFKVYRPLRNDPNLFSCVRVSEDGSAVVWPDNPDLEISADALEDLSEQKMSPEAFAQFLKEMGWTFDMAAAQLGISRRMVAYYAADRAVPRVISLACKWLESTKKPRKVA